MPLLVSTAEMNDTTPTRVLRLTDAGGATSATAGLAGTLLSTNVRLDGRVGTAPIEGELVLAPFEDRWLARARATA